MIGLNFSPKEGNENNPINLLLRDGLKAERFTPVTTNITGLTHAKGIFQKCFGLCFVFIRFTSSGSLAIPTNATIKLPIEPYSASNGAAFEFASHSFELSSLSTTANQKCSMSSTTGLISPIAAIAATANHYVLSGYYLIN